MKKIASKLYNSAAAGTGPLQIEDFDDISEILLMAAIQFHTQGMVDDRLMQNKELAKLMQTEDPVGLLHQVIDAMHSADNTKWDESKYPPSVVNVAQGIHNYGIIQHGRIFGDAFKGISGEKLALIRTGHIDEDDADYGAFLKQVDAARADLEIERQRKEFRNRAEAAIDALEALMREDEQAAAAVLQEKTRRRDQIKTAMQQQVIAYATMAARADAALRDIFIESPDADRNKQLLVNGTASLVGLSIVFSQIADDVPAVIAPVQASAAQSYEEENTPVTNIVGLQTAASRGQCSADAPILVDGKTYNFLIDDPRLCGELLRMIPAKGRTLQLNEFISLKANDDGTFFFRIAAPRAYAECLRNAPDAIKAQFIARGRAEGKTSIDDICHWNDVRTNTISSRNMNAMIEAWLYSGGRAGRPIPFTYFLSKWFLESRHGQLMANPDTSAKGMNQFIRLTWLEQVLLHGDRLGAGDVRDRLVAIAAGMGISESKLMDNPSAMRKLSKNRTVRQMHVQYTADPFHSAVFGSEYSLAGLLRLQNAFETGKMKHPYGAGHTEVTSKMGYICHLLGPRGSAKFFAGWAKDPNQKVRNVVTGEPYRRNDYLFKAVVPKRDKQGNVIMGKNGKPKTQRVVDMTIREFTDYLEVFGFDDKPMEGLAVYQRLGADALAQNQNIQFTLLTEEEAKDYTFTHSDSARTAIASDDYPRWTRRVIPATAQPIAPVRVHAVPAPRVMPVPPAPVRPVMTARIR